MIKRSSILAAATLAVAGLGLYTNSWGQAADDAAKQAAGQQAKDAAPALPPGVKAATKDDSKDIREMLAHATEVAFTPDGFDNLVGNFVDADRNRIGEFVKKADKNTWDVYNGIVRQINTDWQAKYGQKFDMKTDQVFGPDFKGLQIIQGEITDPALLSNWPLPQKTSSDAKGADKKVEVTADAQPAQPAPGAPGNKPADRNLEKGRNVAVVYIPRGHGAPELTASLIHENPDSWKIDVPDNVDGQKLLTNINAHLTEFAKMKDQWPTDVNDAYRAATHHVLAAVYDVSAKNQGGADRGDAARPGEERK